MNLSAFILQCTVFDIRKSSGLRLFIMLATIILIYSMSQVNIVSSIQTNWLPTLIREDFVSQLKVGFQYIYIYLEVQNLNWGCKLPLWKTLRILCFKFQFCCRSSTLFEELTLNGLSGGGKMHLSCDYPQYIFLAGVLSFISVSVFLKLAAGIKFLLMAVMLAVYIVVMEITHRDIFETFDMANR